jgi:hypothetical protein
LDIKTEVEDATEADTIGAIIGPLIIMHIIAVMNPEIIPAKIAKMIFRFAIVFTPSENIDFLPQVNCIMERRYAITKIPPHHLSQSRTDARIFRKCAKQNALCRPQTYSGRTNHCK